MGKRVVALVAAAVMLLSFAACGKKQPAENQKPETTVNQVTERKVFIIGFYEDAEPFGYTDENGTYHGFDLEIGKELARRLGVTLNLRAVTRENALSELESGSIDFLGNNLFLTDDALDRLEETDEIFENRQVIVTKSDSGIENQSQLSDKKVGVIKGEKSQEALADEKGLAKKVQQVEIANRTEALAMLGDGRVDALVIDEAWAYAQMEKGSELRLVGKAIADDDYSVVLRSQDEELCKKVNELIKEMRNDGTLDKLTKKCFGKDYATFQ